MVVGGSPATRLGGGRRWRSVAAWSRAGGRKRKGAGERGAHREHNAVVGDGGEGRPAAQWSTAARRRRQGGGREWSIRGEAGPPSKRATAEELEGDAEVLRWSSIWTGELAIDGKVLG